MCFLLRRVNVTNFSITLLCLITAFGIYIDKKYSVVSVTSPVTSNARPPPSSEERVPVSLPDESLSEESRNAIVYDCATWQPLPERINSVARGQAGHGHANITAESQEDKDVADISKRRSWRKLKTNKLVDNPSVDNSDLKDVKYVFAALHAIINRLKIELNKKIIKVIDLFCGDDNALKLFLDFREDVEYTGEDVCPDTGTVVSHRHINAYIDNVSFIFKNVDIVNNTLKDPYDVIVCRKLLHRLRMNDAMNILKRISKSGSRFLIATTNSDVKLNSDIVSNAVRVRRLNPGISPIQLSPPVCVSLGSYMGMWKLPLTVIS